MLITWFGVGLSPKAPGTMGSVAALPLCYFILQNDSILLRILFTFGFTAIAVIASAQDQYDGGKRDPGYVVIDEVAGMLWSTALLPNTPSLKTELLIAFICFRFFDIVKIWPASYFDNNSKTDPSAFRRGIHIVFDDVIAGVFAFLSLGLLHRIFIF